MMQRTFATLALATALAGCALVQPAGGDAEVKRAEAAGRIAGRKCGPLAKDHRPAIEEALVAARGALAQEDFTLAALQEAMTRLSPEAQEFGGMVVGDVVDAMVLLGVPYETVAKDSPLVIGLGTAIVTCEQALNQAQEA